VLRAGGELHHPPPLVTNEMANILVKKGLLFVEGEGHRAQRRQLLPAFLHAHIQGPDQFRFLI